jgi:hypothetical protein
MKSRNNLLGFAWLLALTLCVPAAKAGVDPKLECVKLKTALTLEWQNQERLNQLHKQVISVIVDEYKGLIPVKWKTEKHKRLNNSYLEAHNSQGILESNSLKEKVNVLKLTGVNAELAEKYGSTLSHEGITRLYAKYKTRYLLSKEYEEATSQLAVLQITPSSAPTKLEIFCREYGVYWR